MVHRWYKTEVDTAVSGLFAVDIALARLIHRSCGHSCFVGAVDIPMACFPLIDVDTCGCRHVAASQLGFFSSGLL